MKTTHQSNTNAHGFTLVEVLIAILILALGILGLGAVFPVVITQQRNAVETVEGESVASIAESRLRSGNDFIDFSPWFDPDSNFGKINPADTAYMYEWIVDPFPPYNGYEQRPGFDPVSGFWYINLDTLSIPPASADELNQVLAVKDRLVPAPYSGQDPKYVWDVVARLHPGTERPQLGIFVRRVDARIRVPKDETLSSVLTSDSPGAEYPLLPVALDFMTGKPVVDSGSNDHVYSSPQTLQVQVRREHLDWLIIENAASGFFDSSISFASQPGQKLLDNTGTVRTVIGAPEYDPAFPILRDANARVLVVEPPFSMSQAVDATGPLMATDNDPPFNATVDDIGRAERRSWVRQIVFTPRIPVAIRVISLEEPSP